MRENSTRFDVMIIGGGPAGLSAGLWCADLGLRAIVLEKELEFGGQLLWTFNRIENYLGIETTTGRELRDRFLRHVETRSLHRLPGTAITAVNLNDKTVTIADGTIFAGRSIIIATGVRRRRLEVPGEVEFAGRGVLFSGVKSHDEVSEKNVVIVGGGDAALENALILSETAKKVTVVHRRCGLSARHEFIQRAREQPAISFVFDTTVNAIVGNSVVEAVELFSSGERSLIPADAVLIRIGVTPNTELVCEQLATDVIGYVKTDVFCATTVAGIYAVGDVAGPVAPTISGAVGHGATAAKSAVNWLASESKRS